MHLTIPILAVAFHFALLLQSLAAMEAEDLNVKQTTELLRKPLGEIKFPEATLERRIVALRATAATLGIKLTLSSGVEAAAKRWIFPAISFKEGNMTKALQYTSDNTQLIFSVRPGEVHLLLAGEIPKKAGIKPDAIDGADPFK